MSGYTSARARLTAVAEIFTGRELMMQFGWRSTICSTYLANWRKAGLIRALGGRSDVYMNLVRNIGASPEAALAAASPRAIKVGADVLREAGWTTQIPSTIEVAVPTSSPRYTLSEFKLTTRSETWFERISKGLRRAPHGLTRLKPGWALVDMIARAHDARVEGAWLLDPDDLNLESARQDKETQRALKAFALDSSCISDHGYAQLCDTLGKRTRAATAIQK
jgi:hypothetical protein